MTLFYQGWPHEDPIHGDAGHPQLQLPNDFNRVSNTRVQTLRQQSFWNCADCIAQGMISTIFADKHHPWLTYVTLLLLTTEICVTQWIVPKGNIQTHTQNPRGARKEWEWRLRKQPLLKCTIFSFTTYTCKGNILKLANVNEKQNISMRPQKTVWEHFTLRDKSILRYNSHLQQGYGSNPLWVDKFESSIHL